LWSILLLTDSYGASTQRNDKTSVKDSLFCDHFKEEKVFVKTFFRSPMEKACLGTRMLEIRMPHFKYYYFGKSLKEAIFYY